MTEAHPASSVAVTTLLAALLASPAPVHAQPFVDEVFDADLGAWNFSFGAQSNGFALGWSDTDFAGGVAGEFGALLVRHSEPTGDLSMPRVLDTASFATALDLNQPFEASGWMLLDDVSNDAGLDVHLGFFNSNNPLNERLIVRIQPNGGDEWRFRMSANASSGTRIDAPLGFDSVPLEWSFAWVPTGSGGTGTLTGSVSDGITTLTLPAPLVGGNTATVNSFGVWANSASSSDPARTQRMYVDDVRYTVPEPACGLASAVGALVAAVIPCRRRSARCARPTPARAA